MRFPTAATLAVAGTMLTALVAAPSAAAYGDVPSQRANQTGSEAFVPSVKRAVPVPPKKVKKPRPASRSTKAKNVPEMPMDGGSGRRIIYDKS
jgi:hypothetical protein